MKENQLRELLRKEIRAQLNENDFLKNVSGAVRGALGSKKQQLATGLAAIADDKIGNMTPDKKAELVAAIITQLGLTDKDVDGIKNRLAKKVGKQTPKLGVGASMKTEAKSINEMQSVVDLLNSVDMEYLADAWKFASSGQIKPMISALDNAAQSGPQISALLAAAASSTMLGRGVVKGTGKIIGWLKKKKDAGELELSSQQEKDIDALAKQVPTAELNAVMAEVKSYYKQKALLEAKRRNLAKRK